MDEMKVNTNALKGNALDEIKAEADALEERFISKLFDVLLFFVVFPVTVSKKEKELWC